MVALDVSVNKLFHEEASVIVWRNITKLGIIPTGHFGHAAIMLRGASLGLGQGDYNYISWWPPSAGKEDALRQQAGIAEDDYHSDMKDETADKAVENLKSGKYGPRPNQLKSLQGWGTASDAQVSVPGIGSEEDPTHTFGVCLNRMWAWWNAYQKNNGNYQLASKTQSCAGVALVALIEGGGGGFASPPSIKIYAEPKQVEAYARSLQRAILDFNKRAAQFELQARKSMRFALADMGGGTDGGFGGVTGFGKATDLWSMTDWKRQSSEPRVRSSIIRKIDSNLQKFHKKDWNTDFADKYKYLIQVMDGVMEHRMKKPDSKRAFSLNRLGLQAIEVTRALRTMA